MTDEEFELMTDTAEKAAVAKGIRCKKGYKSKKVILPYEALKGEERKKYMGETTISSNLQELTWDQFKAMAKEDKVKTLKRLICTYGNSRYRLSTILECRGNYIDDYIRNSHLRPEMDRYWDSIPKDQQDAAIVRGITLARQRREQKKAMAASQNTPQEVPKVELQATPEQAAPHMQYWAETTIRRDGVLGKDIRAQLLGLIQSVTDDGVYDVKIAVGARME